MSKTKRLRKNPHNGGSFDDFLKEQGIFETVQATAMKRVFAMQIAEVMKRYRRKKPGPVC